MKKAKIVFFMGVSLILIAVGILMLSGQKPAKAANDSFVERWEIKTFRNIYATDDVGIENWSKHPNTLGASLGPAEWKIYGCSNTDVLEDCVDDYTYQITYSVPEDGWHYEGFFQVYQGNEVLKYNRLLENEDFKNDEYLPQGCWATDPILIVSCYSRSSGYLNRGIVQDSTQAGVPLSIRASASVYPIKWNVVGTMLER